MGYLNTFWSRPLQIFSLILSCPVPTHHPCLPYDSYNRNTCLLRDTRICSPRLFERLWLMGRGSMPLPSREHSYFYSLVLLVTDVFGIVSIWPVVVRTIWRTLFCCATRDNTTHFNTRDMMVMLQMHSVCGFPSINVILRRTLKETWLLLYSCDFQQIKNYDQPVFVSSNHWYWSLSYSEKAWYLYVYLSGRSLTSLYPNLLLSAWSVSLLMKKKKPHERC